MKAVKIHGADEVAVEELPRPVPEPNEVLIKVMSSGICGTDLHIYRGEYMGDYPVLPGHEFSGVVEEIGSTVTRFEMGDRVAVEPNICCNNCYNCLHNRQNFCLNWRAVGVKQPGGMAQYVAVPEENTFDIGTLPFEAGALVEPLSCVLHGAQKVDLQVGDRVALLGAGPIGILMLHSLRSSGAVEFTVVEKNAQRLAYIEECGADICMQDASGLKKDHYDVVVDATGSIPLMSRTIEFVRHGGTVLLFGVPPMGQLMEIEPFVLFRKGLTVVSSFTSVRNSYQALSILQSGIIDVQGLVSHRLPLEQFERGLTLIEKGSENVRKIMIEPNP
jgi:2-desacetyl-2-hydroxyethyl bacteriochlorophyllide A dehydrogenase